MRGGGVGVGAGVVERGAWHSQLGTPTLRSRDSATASTGFAARRVDACGGRHTTSLPQLPQASGVKLAFGGCGRQAERVYTFWGRTRLPVVSLGGTRLPLGPPGGPGGETGWASLSQRLSARAGAGDSKKFCSLFLCFFLSLSFFKTREKERRSPVGLRGGPRW